ncbi:Paf1-domain-containing protein [Phakopsora pachyrhizi]|uniref:Paf1-domain-containing protein n=1 Tax=Phakopsora pachyrhizi TaxID=170000 RepID=A0AAV0AY23_PHAPC|nr:Paf1-domain-containing protein [Phakopsora pachyrhizi]CAH7675317.1 Paf1-domain-containing protein [Phakopsora pachyrhizi]
MSKKVAPSPLLIRHRYLNPFPAPPFPPKLLHISTDPSRYAGYRFLSQLENEREIQVLADSDLGMPIELGLEADGSYGLGTYWEGDPSVVCPDQPNPRQSTSKSLEADDLALLIDPSPAPGSSISIGNGHLSSNSHLNISNTPHRSSKTINQVDSPMRPNSTPITADRKKVDVTWLRRTEYFNEIPRKSNVETPSLTRTKSQLNLLPKTRTERLEEINKGFEVVKNQSLDRLVHPKKSNLKAIDSFELLPDQNTWPNSYHLFRFQENPSDMNQKFSSKDNDLRLERSILRPIKVKGEARLAYYLPVSVEDTLKYQKLQLSNKTIDELLTEDENGNVEENEADDDNEEEDKEDSDQSKVKNDHSEPTHELRFVRDYEIVQSKYLNQHLLIFDDGKSTETQLEDSNSNIGKERRKKGAYFHPIGGFNILRKRRPKLNEQFGNNLKEEFEGDENEMGEGEAQESQVWDEICIRIDKSLNNRKKKNDGELEGTGFNGINESIKESRIELINEVRFKAK